MVGPDRRCSRSYPGPRWERDSPGASASSPAVVALRCLHRGRAGWALRGRRASVKPRGPEQPQESRSALPEPTERLLRLGPEPP